MSDLWKEIGEEVSAAAAQEPVLAGHLTAVVLECDRLEQGLARLLGGKLETKRLPSDGLSSVFEETMSRDPGIAAAVVADLHAIRERDPACTAYCMPFLYGKGFHALSTHRIAHWLHRHGRHPLASMLQSRCSETFGVDIHPAARIGRGILIDHATSVVIGETAVVEDDVSMLHEVTLGGTGKQSGDRHPKVRRGVLIGAGAKVLGNVEVGEGAKVAAGSVVLHSVPPHSTVAGVPARVVGHPAAPSPALEMDHRLPGELGDGI